MLERNVRTSGHKFQVGQSVQFFPDRGIDHKAKGQYTIVRLLPMDGFIPQYRAKNNVDGSERMVRETEINTR